LPYLCHPVKTRWSNKLKERFVQRTADLLSVYKQKIFNSSFLKNLFIYSSGALFLKGVAFFLIPLYTSVLAPHEYGFLELLNTIITILNILFAFGLSQVVYIEYYHLNTAERKALAKHIVNTYTVLALPLFVLAGIALYYWDHVLFEQPVTAFVALLVVVHSFLYFYQGTFFSVLQISKRAYELTVNKVIVGLFTAIFNIVLVYYLRMGVIGVLISNFVVLSLSLVYPLYLYIKSMKPINLGLDFKQSYKYIKLGFPFIISSLSYWLLAGVDRWLILSFLGESSVGLYSVAYKFSSVFEPLLIAPVLSVYTPYIFERFSKGLYNQRKVLMFAVVVVFFTALAFATQFIAKFAVDAQYHEALSLVPYLVGGFGFFFLAQLLSTAILYFKKSNILVLNVTLSGAMNIVFNIALIKHMGLEGAGMASLISNFAWFVLTAAQNYYIIKTETKNQSTPNV
jgi:O-antigen/teichoic acid export membrane protein